MGKVTSIYLTDEEASELKRFCEENQCTQYSAIKTGLRELLAKPKTESKEVNQTDEEEREEKTSSIWDRLGKELEKRS
ncbi:MAG: hypothetical protein NWF13_03970 [Candidatus Bathyarchaeota archaeon]|nr:hypothetical protein [Candidatus Bathyarchaeota archaeon]